MSESSITSSSVRRRPTLLILAAAAILCFGAAIRIVPSAGSTNPGFDAARYREYALAVEHAGLLRYPLVYQHYLERQSKVAEGYLPPTRLTYIVGAWMWKHARFGDAPPLRVNGPAEARRDPFLRSFREISCLFSIATFILAGVAAWRMLGERIGVAVLALMAFSPTQIHMAQHPLIDGVFVFWALLCLWLLWECLRHPDSRGWQAAYMLALAGLVITKENSAFVVLGLGGIIVLNRWTHFGKVTPRLLLLSVLGCAAGASLLILSAGGLGTLVETLQLNAAKIKGHPVAILLGDGPWYRYLLDLMLVSPVTFLCAIGGLFALAPRERSLLFVVVFTACTYAVMCNIPYGINLRYGLIWEFPICLLAAAMLSSLAPKITAKFAHLAFAVAILAMCLVELRQYTVLFVASELLELDARGLLMTLQIVK